MAGARGCWICAGEFAEDNRRDAGNWLIDCATCGRYKISDSLHASAFVLPESERYRLSWWCKQHVLDGRQPPHLTEYSINEITSALPKPDPSERADILLSSVAKLYPRAGSYFQLDITREYSLACATDGAELQFHRDSLASDGFLMFREGNKHQQRLTSRGWARAKTLQQVNRESRVGFVAMSFSSDMLELWETVFVPALATAGFTAERSMAPAHNDRIDVAIIAAIKRSRFVVADVTHARTGVYFEAGYALGLGLPVIWACRKGQEKDMHFDTRQYAHILWESPAHLAAELTARVIATI
jgi:hypothetical protein